MGGRCILYKGFLRITGGGVFGAGNVVVVVVNDGSGGCQVSVDVIGVSDVCGGGGGGNGLVAVAAGGVIAAGSRG